MLEQILRFAIHQRWLVLLAVLGMAALGVYNYQRLPIDAVPDITNVQVQVNTEAPGYSPLEAEQRITFPIETAMAGLPHLQETRSLSRYGLSQVTVIFEDGTDIYFARQLINERVQEVRQKLPPVSSRPWAHRHRSGRNLHVDRRAEGRGEKPDGTAYTTDLRTIQDWIVRPQLRNIPGVTEINTIGGYLKQFHVTPDPARLVGYGLSFHDVLAALAGNNANVGAGYIEKSGEQYLVRVPGQVATLEEIGDIDPHRARRADPRQGPGRGAARRNCATRRRHRERQGRVAWRCSCSWARTAAPYRNASGRSWPRSTARCRKAWWRRRSMTARRSWTRPSPRVEKPARRRALVVVVLLALLGNWRAALLTAAVIPLSMLFLITGMVENKVSANLMSLGALDFGLIVDGAVIIVENCLRRLALEQHRLDRMLARGERFEVVFEATREVFKPSLVSVIVVALVNIPIFTLTGVEGKMFHPMAFTVVVALLGALVLSLTFVPAAIALSSSPAASRKRRIASCAGQQAMPTGRRWTGAAPAGPTVAAGNCHGRTGALLATRMGAEFVPEPR
jgi:cobalt-zinc-cadmium resistance protein CzcA